MNKRASRLYNIECRHYTLITRTLICRMQSYYAIKLNRYFKSRRSIVIKLVRPLPRAYVLAITAKRVPILTFAYYAYTCILLKNVKITETGIIIS